MPFICLAQSTIADGIVNILDLLPNSSLRNLIYEPVGQTKYVNRVQNEAVFVNATGLVLRDTRGLGAYLVDNVEVGGNAFATGTIQAASVLNTNTVTIGGVLFTAVDGGAADPALQQFDSLAGSGSDINTAASLVATINNAASQALFGPGPTVTAANGGTDTVTVTADVAGATGDLALATNSALTVILSGATMTRASGTAWTQTTLGVATAALIARVDAGQSLTLTDVNTILGAVGATLTGATGTLVDLLSILAGRGYLIRAGAAVLSGGAFNPTRVGGFTEGKLVWDTAVNTSTTGTTVQYEVKPIKATYDGGAFQMSLLLGALNRFATGVTLWPDSDQLPPIAGQTVQVDNARLITVYDDDGSLLV